MAETKVGKRHDRPNFFILCKDQWQAHMEVPEAVRFPAMERLEAQGVSFDRHYCTTPMCTPSRATMWTGVHAIHTGLWDNTNFAWSGELSSDIPTIGHLLREQGYYTAFKGKWHVSAVPKREDALERYGFSDYQQWGEMYGAPLEGVMLDNTATFEVVDWLEHKAPTLDQPWLLVCSLVNPHDIMFLQTDPIQEPHPNSPFAGLMTTVQQLGWFEKKWDISMPANFADDYERQPPGVRHYKRHLDLNYGRIPDDRIDLWLKHRNYLVNCMRLVDMEFCRIIETLDRLDLWQNTVVIFTGDHGEMNGAHRMTQKGGIPFDEACVVNLTVCAPGGPQGKRTAAVGSHLDLAPTLLAFAGLSEEEIRERYPHLKGRSLKSVITNPAEAGPRGSINVPGDGALICWDALNMLDTDWSLTGALKELSDMSLEFAEDAGGKPEKLRQVGLRYGAPDFTKRNFFRCIVDGRYKLVRWFSPEEYGNPSKLAELLATSDVALYDLVNDPGELDNIAHPDSPRHDPTLIEHMLAKLHALVEQEIGEDRCPFDLDMFGTREVKYRSRQREAASPPSPTTETTEGFVSAIEKLEASPPKGI